MALPKYVSMGFSLNDASISLMRAGIRVDRAALLPATGVTALFTITGRIMLLNIVGEVTIQLGAVATNMKIQANPTAAGSSVDMCAVSAVANSVVGTLISISGTAATALQTGLAVPGMDTPWILQAGTIDMNNSAAVGSGAVKWSCHYVPMDDTAVVVAA